MFVVKPAGAMTAKIPAPSMAANPVATASNMPNLGRSLASPGSAVISKPGPLVS
jgi:hypothetical protein